MSIHHPLLEISDEEADYLDSIFNPKIHGEVRLEMDEITDQLIVNWFDTSPMSCSIFKIETHADKAWASSFTRLHVENVKNKFLAESGKKLELENQHLKEQVAALNRKIFGTSSEQSTSSPTNEAVIDNNLSSGLERAINQQDKKPRLLVSNAGRKALPVNLPRERIEYKLPPEKQFCECCYGKLHEFGEEVTEKLNVIPAQYKVTQHVRKKYLCRHCDKFTMAEGPKSLIPGSSYASPEFLATVASNRFQLSLPYYRQEASFNQAGLPFNRTTLANLMISSADKMTALYEVMKDELRSQHIIHADETSFQVLKETGRAPQSTSYLWQYRSGGQAKNKIVVFEYQPTRSGSHPINFLAVDENGFNGYLCTDGYAGYNKIPGVVRVGCMAHIRRKFDEALKTLPAGAEGSYSWQAIQMIGKLYAIERELTAQPSEVKYKVRQAESLPILHELKQWLDRLSVEVVPRSALGRAIGYALGQWDHMLHYVDDGRLAIDNNISEREIKAFVIGRKNWLFADSVDGAYANAVMYSLVQTAKANGLDPYKYLYHVFERMPYMRNSEEVKSLLPWNVQFTEDESLKIAA